MTQQHTDEEFDAMAKENARLRGFVEILEKITAPEIKPNECKAGIILAFEVWKGEQQGSMTPVDHLARTRDFSKRVGVSENTARDIVGKLNAVKLVVKRVEHQPVNRYGEDIDVKNFDPEHGSRFETRSWMDASNLDGDEWTRKLTMASGLRSANQVDAKNKAKAERQLIKVVEKLKTMQCPVCGKSGELHLSCACGWKDADLPAEPVKVKAVRAKCSKFEGDKRGLKIDYRSPNYTPPCPDDLCERRDERMTLHAALKGLSGKHTSQTPPMDYAHYDDPGINVVIDAPAKFEGAIPPGVMQSDSKFGGYLSIETQSLSRNTDSTDIIEANQSLRGSAHAPDA